MYYTPKCGLHSTKFTDVCFMVKYTQDKSKSKKQLTLKIRTITWNANQPTQKSVTKMYTIHSHLTFPNSRMPHLTGKHKMLQYCWKNALRMIYSTWRGVYGHTFYAYSKGQSGFFSFLDYCVIVWVCSFVTSCFIWKFVFCLSLPPFVWFPALFSPCSPVSY